MKQCIYPCTRTKDITFICCYDITYSLYIKLELVETYGGQINFLNRILVWQTIQRFIEEETLT